MINVSPESLVCIVLYFLPRDTDSDYLFCIFKLYFAIAQLNLKLTYRCPTTKIPLYYNLCLILPLFYRIINILIGV